MNEFVKMNGGCVDVTVFYWLEDGRHSQGLHVLKLGGEIAAHCWVSLLAFLLIVLPVSSSPFSRIPLFLLSHPRVWLTSSIPSMDFLHFFLWKKEKKQTNSTPLLFSLSSSFSPSFKDYSKKWHPKPTFYSLFFFFFSFCLLLILR